MELYIIRHGETKWNSEKRLQGRSDIELNEYGIELARITSEALKDVKFDRIYSSPLREHTRRLRYYEAAVNLILYAMTDLRKCVLAIMKEK